MSSLRLFISLPLLSEVKQALLGVQKRLPSPFFKPLPKENFHLTLAFLGDTRAEDIPALERILDEIAGRASAFPCMLSGLGGFPNPWEPRVVWVGIDVGSKESGMLSEALRTRLRQAKVSFDAKPFRPHITIAYARKSLSRMELREAGEEFSKLVREMGAFSRLQFFMDEIALVKSELRPEGAIHTPIHIARFQGADTYEPRE